MIATPESSWDPDILGTGFENRPLALGTDPDGEGEVEARLVRYLPEELSADDFAARPALVWVHGMTDYFFEDHVARRLHDAGYAFYAVDLRKCGRARKADQTWHYASDFSLYFPDLDAMAQAVCGPHPSLTPMAHSTAGIIVPLWLDYLRREHPEMHKRVAGLVLNSPWLDIMGVPDWVLPIAAPVLGALGKAFPRLPFPGGGLTAFGDSIHASRFGEFDFSLDFKPLGGHKKYLGWLRAVLAGQKRVHEGDIDVGVPTLVLCSTRSELGKPYSPSTDTADVVIDTRQTQRWAPSLGSHVQVHPILGARHEVFLSLSPAREEAFRVTEQWLAHHVRHVD